MKKQTLLALSAGLAITASGLTFANTQSNSFQSGSQEGTTIIGSSDQGSTTNDQTVTNQGQTDTTTGTLKKKIAEGNCGATGKCSKDSSKTTSTDDDSSSQNTSSDDTTTQTS